MQCPVDVKIRRFEDLPASNDVKAEIRGMHRAAGSDLRRSGKCMGLLKVVLSGQKLDSPTEIHMAGISGWNNPPLSPPRGSKKPPVDLARLQVARAYPLNIWYFALYICSVSTGVLLSAENESRDANSCQARRYCLGGSYGLHTQGLLFQC